MSTIVHFVQLKDVPIFEQLEMEEALLRADDRNICLVNVGSPPAIVMGISGEPQDLLDIESVRLRQIPVIKRFSGGGTVFVDEHTLFVTFIFNKETLPIQPFPEPILRWSTELYQKAWQIPAFTLHENDYAIENRKCGGNAHYIRKERWLHHTTFLWDYQEENMSCLLLPKKRPAYRKDRPHKDFLCRLKSHAPRPQHLIEKLKEELVKRFDIQDLPASEAAQATQREYRKSTQQIIL